MRPSIESAFEPLHILLSQLQLLALLTGDDLTLDNAERQDLCDWMRQLIGAARDQAIEAERAAFKAARGEQ